jgi:D-lactate dehydrogenase (cytochrome)
VRVHPVMASSPSWLSRPTAEALAAGTTALTDVIGSDRVAVGENHRLQHGRDESFLPVEPPDIVVWPRSADEAAAIVRVAIAHRLPLVPFGAGTSLEGQVAARAGGISVDMREMNRIHPPSVEDFDVVVEAGVTRRELEARLLPEGVFFPVDPGADATVGGMIATRASGTTTVRYGSMRDNVLALTLVDGRGNIVRTGSRARKSASGYDLTRLMVGSEGTLGLICEATLRVQPTPDAIAAAVCSFPTVADAINCAVALGYHSIPVARVEFCDELMIAALNRHLEMSLTPAPTLILEFHGRSAADVQAQAVEAGELATGYGGTEFEWTSGESERRRLWRARHSALDANKALRPGSVPLTTDVCVPISELAAAIRDAQADIRIQRLTATIVGHVGDGNFHVAVMIDPARQEEVESAERFHARLVRRALAVGGTSTGEHGIGYGKARFLVEEHGRPAVEMMQAIKLALDPYAIFNPGKHASTALAMGAT